MVSPLLVILIGRLSLPSHFAAAFREESKHFLAILGTPTAAALVMGTLSLAIASYVTRRGIGSAAVLGTFLLTAALTGILMETLDGARYLILANPILTVGGAVLALFGERPDRGSSFRQAHLPPEIYYGAVIAYAVVFALLLLHRYRKLGT